MTQQVNDKLTSYVNVQPQQILTTHEDEFSNRIYLNTLQRGQSLAVAGILLNTLLLFGFDYQAYRQGLWTNNRGYYYAFLWRTFAMIGFSGFLAVYWRFKPYSFESIHRIHRIMAISLVSFLLVLGVWLSTTNQFIIGDVSMYTLGILGVAVVFHLPNRLRWVFYPVSLAALATGLQWAKVSDETMKSLMTNATSVVIVAFILERLTFKQQIRSFIDMKVIERERAISENLLTNVLPIPIAQRLRQNNQMIADAFVESSVLFADLVGFTELSARMTPENLVQILNGIFSRFDTLIEEFGVEKIKTIGDAYMVASGIPLPEPYHARKLALFALSMQTEIARFNEENNLHLQLRIGINSGYVVAGVIGTKKFIYDLWGDTVNVASRMESHGLAGKIQVTSATYEILKYDFDFQEREEILVKGVGPMTTYFLQSRNKKSID